MGYKDSRFGVPYKLTGKMSSSSTNGARQTANGRRGRCQVTWPSLPFAGKKYAALNLSIQSSWYFTDYEFNFLQTPMTPRFGQTHILSSGMTQRMDTSNEKLPARLTPVEDPVRSNRCLKMCSEYVLGSVLTSCVRPKVLPQVVPFRLECSWPWQRFLVDTWVWMKSSV